MLKVIFVSLLAVVDAAEDGVREVDTDLPLVNCQRMTCVDSRRQLTSANRRLRDVPLETGTALRPADRGSNGLSVLEDAILVDRTKAERRNLAGGSRLLICRAFIHPTGTAAAVTAGDEQCSPLIIIR